MKKIKNPQRTYDNLRENLRALIYCICSDGNNIVKNKDEISYYSLDCNVSLDTHSFGLSTLEMPTIVEIRAYIGEGYLCVRFEDDDSIVDMDNLYLEDMICIYKNLI